VFWALLTQLMLGKGLLVTPVLREGVDSVDGYFPPLDALGSPVQYYDFRTHEVMSKSGWVNLPAPIEYGVPVHIVGGIILLIQASALTTVAHAMNNFTFIVAPDARGDAQGELFLDDGETLAVGTNSHQSTLVFTSQVLEYSILTSEYQPAEVIALQQTIVLGQTAAPSRVQLTDEAVGTMNLAFLWDEHTLALTVTIPPTTTLASGFLMTLVTSGEEVTHVSAVSEDREVRDGAARREDANGDSRGSTRSDRAAAWCAVPAWSPQLMQIH
jgi:hypothetical protein